MILTIILKVYQGTSALTPTSEIYTQSVTNFQAESWNDIFLYDPITINTANDYWVDYNTHIEPAVEIRNVGTNNGTTAFTVSINNAKGNEVFNKTTSAIAMKSAFSLSAEGGFTAGTGDHLEPDHY